MTLGDVSLNLVESLEDCGRLLTWLGSRDAESIAVDTETTGLVQRKDHVRLVQVGGMTHGWAIPWEQWNGVFRDVLRRYRGQWILHNSPFDVGMLEFAGVQLPRDRIDDTWVGARVLESHTSGALKPQAARHVDQLAAGAQAQLDLAIDKGGWTWATVPVDFAPYWQYGALDTVLTLQQDLSQCVNMLESKPFQMIGSFRVLSHNNINK